MILDIVTRAATALFLLALAWYTGRTALRLDMQVPDGFGVDLTRKQQDIKDALQLLWPLVVVFGLAGFGFAIWALGTAAMGGPQ